MPAPMAAQAAIARKDAVHGSSPPRNSNPAITMASAVTDPTERSMPPEISRIVMPTTTMPSTAKAIAMARMFAQVRKYSEAKDMTTNSARMMRTSPVSRIRSRRRRPPAVALRRAGR